MTIETAGRSCRAQFISRLQLRLPLNWDFAGLPQSLSAPNIIQAIKSRRMMWAGRVARMKERSGSYSVQMGKPEGKRTLGRSRLRYEDKVNPLNAKLNRICHLLALLGAHLIFHVSGVRVKMNMQEMC